MFTCRVCRRKFEPTLWQQRTHRYGRKTVVCSFSCRGKLNAEARRKLNGYKKCSPKIMARKAIMDAVRSGRLVRPARCAECKRVPGANRIGRAQVQAHHHKGYERPLDVKWLCHTCHAKKDVDRVVRGEQSHAAKLDATAVREIRFALSKQGSVTALARKFSVSLATVKRVGNGTTWGHVT